jgi:formate dehydrogenase (coenzyme F420) beta subunit
MAKTANIEVKEKNLLASLQGFLKTLLEKTEIDAILVAQHLPMRSSVMPTLVTDPEKLDGADPLAPAFPLNTSKVLSRLTRKPLDGGGKVAAVLRPCEVRAFIELVKLKQGSMDDIVVIGIDCLGAYSNVNYSRFAAEFGADSTLRFLENMVAGKGGACQDFDLATACQACEYPIPEKADMVIGLVGVDIKQSWFLKANTAQAETLLDQLDLPEGKEPEGRKKAISDLIAGRVAYRDQMFDATAEDTADLEKLMGYLSNCVNCYNCRVACPVCYCKECVFVTDVFDHEPSQYLRWARRKGMLKMPTDTVFYHLTRLAHMSTACIGCGQCSNACPNNIPVMEIFRTIARHTQRAFDYKAGRSLEDEPPLSVFREKEFSEVTGGKD